VHSDGSIWLDELLRRIGSSPWKMLRNAHEDVRLALEAEGSDRALTGLRCGLDVIVKSDRSVEKTTHYKWFLDEDPAGRFQIWLHEYKPKTHRREGHASVAHNHRFWLTSLILRGGFTDTRYERKRESAAISPIESRRMEPGDTMVIDPGEIHSLSELEDGTLSLVVQSEPIRSYSEVFEDGEMRRYYDLEAKLTDLQASL
jgi:predicted metal-dependent enzyme (double-stranded beta helix superfamily)